MRVLPCGDRAVLAEFPGLENALAAYARWSAAPPTGAGASLITERGITHPLFEKFDRLIGPVLEGGHIERESKPINNGFAH